MTPTQKGQYSIHCHHRQLDAWPSAVPIHAQRVIMKENSALRFAVLTEHAKDQHFLGLANILEEEFPKKPAFCRSCSKLSSTN